jgi:DNA-binding LytR/AlgR family response regulator
VSTNPLEILLELQRTPVDLLFLDIQIPQLSGIDLVKAISVKPMIILTTAYRDYAADAYDLDVVDYLVKPFNFERFLKAVGKVIQLKQAIRMQPVSASLHENYEDMYIYLKQDREMVKVFLNDILYIESLKDYVRVKTESRQIITYQKISYLEQKLPDSKFLRAHRSYIVSLDKISGFNSQGIYLNGINIPIGRNYKLNTMKVLNVKNILAFPENVASK